MVAQSLINYNTFGIDARALSVRSVWSTNHLLSMLKEDIYPFRILGGGSNILITQDLPYHILRNEIKGLEITEENDEQLIVKVGAGEVWHQLVMWTLSHNLGGLENLSLIPGSVGAAPMQNIGAYGVEQDSCFVSLEAVHIETGIKKIFDKEECGFGYRESIFKYSLKDQYFITHVSYRLSKRNHNLHLTYGAISQVLEQWHIGSPTIHDVSRAVIHIRQSKLPDPRETGNAGSFFKNPVVERDLYEKLSSIYPDLVAYPQPDGRYKVAAGWLIEKAGYKGVRRQNVGVHKHQALVLVNYGGGTGQEILQLSQEIQRVVKDKFGIVLDPEVNIW